MLGSRFDQDKVLKAMPKSRSRRPSPRRRPASKQRGVTIDLKHGVLQHSGMRIRLARPADLEAVQRLLPMAEPSLAEEGTQMLDHPMLGAAILRALQRGRPRPSLADVPSRNPYDLTIALSLLLVAEDERRTVVGVLMALPPVRILGQFLQAGVPLPDILAAAQTVIKLKAVAVEPAARGRGIGTALINLCVELYTGLRWRAIYGQIDKRSQLEPYYTQLGFAVLRPREGLDLQHLASFPLAVFPLGGERLFIRWLGDDAPDAAKPKAT